MVLNGEIVSVIVGAFLAGVIGIFTVYLTKYCEVKRTKKYTSRALLSEVEENQNRLQIFATLSRASEDLKQEVKESKNAQKFLEWIELSFDKNIDQIIGNKKLPKSISFDRTIYSALSDKIGLLEPKSRKKVVQYYAKIRFLEDLLRAIHETYLPPTDYSEEQIQLFKEIVTKGYFTNAEETYKIGEEVIKSLKEQI
jgi:hypothetical protein